MRLIFALLAIAFLCAPVHAQSLNKLCFPTNAAGTNCQNVTSSNPLPVDATVSASISGFAPSLAYGTCTATGSSCASTAIPTNTGSVILFNAGTATVSCTLASGAATATTNELQIPASSGLPIATTYASTTYDHFACIDQTGSTSNVVIASGGSGLPTGWGGGGGGGSGGAVTIADGAVSSGAYSSGSIASGAMVDLGTQADSACSTDNGSCSLIALQKRGNQNLTTLNTTAGSAIPAGTNKIGTIDPATIATWGLMSGTTPGTAPTNTLITGGIYNSTAPTLTNGQTAPLQIGPRGGLLLGGAGYPAGSTPETISATGTTGATTATLATGASVTTYICGFSIRANATAAATGNATVTGTITGTLNYTQWTAPNASGLGVTEQIFTPCIPASAVNTGIAVISAAPGTGGVVSVTAWGFTL